MDRERQIAIGAFAADRPLLVATLFAVGLAALATTGGLGLAGDAARASAALAGFGVADFAIQALIALAVPVAVAAAAPAGGLRRIAVGLFAAGVVYAAAIVAARFSPVDLSGIAPSPAAALVTAGLILAFVVMRPFFGATAGLSAAAPLAGVLGATGAAGLLTLDFAAAGGNGFLGAVVALGLGLGCVAGLGVAADFARAFARGAAAHDAAAIAAQGALAPMLFVVLSTAGVFLSGLSASGSPGPSATFGGGMAAAAGVGLCVAASLFLTAGALALRNTSDAVAVDENYRRRRARDLWRPFRAALPASSAIAVTAILMILTIVAALEVNSPAMPVKLIAAAACATAAGLAFVSLRSGLFVLIALVTTSGLVEWAGGGLGVAAPDGYAGLAALAAAAALFGQLALAWRDARSPRRKPHEAAEAAMIDGAYRYIASVGFIVAAFLIAATSGVWTEGVGAAVYFVALAGFGFAIAPALMTAITAIAGRR